MHRTDERGAVTAEAAFVIPLLALVAVTLAFLVTVVAAHVRALDAAREVARSLARGDDRATGLDLGRRVAAAGSRFQVALGDGTVAVTVHTPLRGPGGLFRLLGYDVTAEAVALQEGQ